MKRIQTVKFFFLQIVLISGLACFSQVSGTVTAVSDYVWRGVSQTDEDPALQASLDYAGKAFYIGLWGSDLPSPLDMELNGYLGYTRTQENGLSWDIGYLHYRHTGDSETEFGEVYLGLGFKVSSIKYSYDFENENGYLEGALDFELPKNFGIGAHVGHYDFDLGGSYTDYKLTISKNWENLSVQLAYSDTDLDNFPIADKRLFGVLSYTWGGE